MRECGVLLAVSSLPSKYGIGTFSKEAYQFVDWLERAGQKYWQVLPLGPTGYGDSPYQSFSAFAGNPYFIDPEALAREGLLTRKELKTADVGSSRYVDYEKLYRQRFLLLRRAYERWKTKAPADIFELAGARLLPETLEYCFFMAVKEANQGKSWDLWEDDLRLRLPAALKAYREKLSDEIGFYAFQQIKFREQWEKLKAYANAKGIRIIGDLPIYVAFDGADSWSHPELFQFDQDNLPLSVAGCPPDDFAVDGQLWGNPLYRWDYHQETDYAWWMERMKYSFGLYDLVRIDHFRGFDEYYSIPYGAKTAAGGQWRKGPGIAIFKKMETVFQNQKLPIIAEDLGFLTPAVKQLLRETGFPGMKVLQFAFDPQEESDYLPHRYEANCVVYTGTHDNDTLQGWYQAMKKNDRDYAAAYLGNKRTPTAEIHWDYIRTALASVACIAIIPMQDYLGLGAQARMNTPSTVGDNWKWRLLKGELNLPLAKRCRTMAALYGRTERK